MSSNRRIVWPRPAVVELQEFDPGELASGAVRIKSIVTLVSPGSETNWLSGKYRFPFPGVGFPFYPGYAVVGRVVEHDPSVTSVGLGDLVFTSGGGHGCHASVVDVAADRVRLLSPALDVEDAVYFTIADVALSAVRRARPELGESVTVVGLGPLGQLAVQAARAAGLTPVVGVDPVHARRQMALASGAYRVVDPADRGWVSSLHSGSGRTDICIELAGGSDAAIQLAMDAVADQGRVIVASRTPERSSLRLVDALFMKSASLTHMHILNRPQRDSHPGLWTERDQWRAFDALVTSGALSPSTLTSSRLTPEQMPDLYARLLDGTSTDMGVLVYWS